MTNSHAIKASRFKYRNTQWLMLLAIVAILLFCSIASGCKDSQVPNALRNVAIDPPQALHAFELVDHKRKPVNLARLKDTWSFLFFGYTNCPDVCPATLSQLMLVEKAIKTLPDYQDNLQFLFVSVDPERDSLQHLADYMAYFGPMFIGMTGDESNIKVVEAQLGAFHRFGSKHKDEYYTVQHSAEVYLIDPAGRLTATFSPPMDPLLVVEQFSQFVHYYSEKTT